LNFLLVDEGIDPHDAIIIEDILEEQGRIDYDPETRCFRQSLTLGRSLDFVVSDFGSLTAWALRCLRERCTRSYGIHRGAGEAMFEEPIEGG